MELPKFGKQNKEVSSVADEACVCVCVHSAAVPEEHCGAPVPLCSAWTPLRPLRLFRVELHQGALLVLQVQGAVDGPRPVDCLRPR